MLEVSSGEGRGHIGTTDSRETCMGLTGFTHAFSMATRFIQPRASGLDADKRPCLRTPVARCSACCASEPHDLDVDKRSSCSHAPQTLWSHPHWTRREKRSKLGQANPVVITVLCTLHTKQQVMQHHRVHKWDLAPFIRVASRVASSVDGACACI